MGEHTARMEGKRVEVEGHEWNNGRSLEAIGEGVRCNRIGVRGNGVGSGWVGGLASA